MRLPPPFSGARLTIGSRLGRLKGVALPPTQIVVPTITFLFGAGTQQVDLTQYVPWWIAGTYVMRVAPTSAPLPSGTDLSLEGILSYDGAGALAVVDDVLIDIEFSADASWLARSTGPGIILAEPFDSLIIAPAGGNVRKYYPGLYGQRGFHDTSIRCSGVGSLRLEHRSGENGTNMTGQFTRVVVDGGGVLGAGFGPGDEFYVQFRYRIDSNWYNNIPTWGGQTHKLLLIYSDDISCGQVELSIQGYPGWHSGRTLRMYTGCGNPNLFTNLTNPDNQTNPPLLVQSRWDIDAGGPPWTEVANGYRLEYGAGSPAGAIMLQPNIWYTFDVRVRLAPAWGQFGTIVEAWVTPAGSTVRGKFISWRGAIFSNGTGETNRFNNLSCTGYFSNDSNNAPTTGSCWYDEVLVGTSPIALPTGLPLS